MRSPIAQSVLKHIQNERMIMPGERLGVAVSGGADSVALLRILEEIHTDIGVPLSIVHFDHQLRGEESERDSQFVRGLAHSAGFEFIVDRQDVAAQAKRRRWNLEDAARQLRYAFFHRVVAERRVARIAVAHTADDQAETVLSHLIRGTGPAGLGGIYPTAGEVPGTIVRPLLPFRRKELRAYLQNIGQAWLEDSTNGDVRRMRARIRSQLLPILERDFSPAIVERLSELARLSREEEAFWSALVEQRYRSLVRPTAAGLSVEIADLLEPLPDFGKNPGTRQPSPAKALEEASRPLAERLVRRLYEGIRGNRRGLCADHVEQVIRLATQSGSGRRVELPGRITVKRVFNQLHFSSKSADAAILQGRETISGSRAYQYTVALPTASTAAAIVSVPELGSRFCLKLIDWADSERETNKDSQTFDADSLRAPLILRNWRPGDTYTPYGRCQPRKLKRMLLAARVPAGQRSEWPVLESAGAVVWARGMPVAEKVRPSDRTRFGVEIAEEKM
jgi:tRNA(Ile)-lysidine synthase